VIVAVIGRLDFHQFGENCVIVCLLLLTLNHAKDGRTDRQLQRYLLQHLAELTHGKTQSSNINFDKRTHKHS